MNCPVCADVSLAMSERSGIEIDYCPACRGVWLDRGEFDKIIERSAVPGGLEPSGHGPAGEPGRGDGSRSRHVDDRHDRGTYRKKKRGSLLGELFDF